jgi:hypothetical protein
MGRLAKYVFRPGIVKEGTNYSNEGGWFDADKVRFRKGRPERIGGWEKQSSDAFIGTCRKIHTYRDIGQTNYTVLGTHQKLYIQEGNTYYDITPIRKTTTNAATFAAVAGSTTLTVTDAGHEAVAGDFVTYSGAVTLGGVIFGTVLNQEYQIDEIVDVNTYKITAKVAGSGYPGTPKAANGSDTGNGGGSVTAQYQINTGLDTYVPSSGWGSGSWGSGSWGTTSVIDATNQLRLWSLDNFGDDTLAAVRLGSYYVWDESSGVGTRAVEAASIGGASNPPTKVLQIMMSDIDRHVIAFGCNPIGSTELDPLLVRFSTSESNIDWTPTATNSAGGVRLSLGSTIVGAVRTRQEIIIFTDAGLISMRFVGAPFIFSFNEVASGVSMISPNAAIVADNKVFFMDRGAFYTYTGAAQRLPCTVLDHIFGDFNYNQTYKVFGGSNPEFNEVIWFYCSEGSEEVDKYVIYNYLEQTWTIGTNADGFTRTSWNEAPTRIYPLATGKLDDTNLNYLYNHEIAHAADGTSFSAFIESSDFDLDPDGEDYVAISKLIPDIEFRDQSGSTNTVTFRIDGRDYPLQAKQLLGSFDITPESTFINTRTRSRQASLKISNTSSDYGWRLGDLRLDIRPDGKR